MAKVNPLMLVGGIVLCGGRSSRMGRPKAWLPFADELMLPRVVRLLREVLGPIVVVAAPDQELPPLPAEMVVVRDAVGGRGPLQGLASGLAALKGTCDAAFLSSCDVPFLQPSFIERMIDLLGDRTIAVPEAGGFRHPMAAVYRLEVLPVIEELLSADRRKLQDLFQKCPTRFVLPEEWADVDPTSRSLRNVNTPEDYAAARIADKQ